MKRGIVLQTVLVLAVAGIFTGCESLRSLLSVERPEVRVAGVELTELSFDGAEITAELAIKNPNPIGISMAGFAWDLRIEGNQFLSGTVDDGISIDANQTSTLPVPVAFGFREVFDTFQALGDATEARYELVVELEFDLPILGRISVPVRAEGQFPVVRVPSVRLAALRLDRLTLSGAELELEIAVENPNQFGLSIVSLDYEFDVAGTPWVNGQTSRPQPVGAGSASVIVLPIDLQFRAVGRTVREVLSGRGLLDYELDLMAVIGTDLRLISNIDLPLNLAGEIELSR